MSELLFEGESRIAAIPGDSRGFAYGDGVFETMRVHRGDVHWWPQHLARLTQGAQRLRIPMPTVDAMRDAIAALFDDGGDGVAKLILSRGGGGRGYAFDADAPPLWRVSRHALPALRDDGLIVEWSDVMLSTQPLLAGLKHCNRLEQILARDACKVDEALLRTAEGDVVCATSANLFVLHGDRWSTPLVDRCGVAGVCRSWLLSQTDAAEVRMTMADVEIADSVLLCNAVRGILPVTRLGARTWAAHPAVEDLRRRLAQAHPGFAAATTL